MIVRRFLLVFALVCVLGAALAIPATAHAQTNVSQQQSVAYDMPSYRFSAGAWGYGYCFSHASTVQFKNDTSSLRAVLMAALSWSYPTAIVGAIALEGQYWLIERVDRGNGYCVAWVFGSPYLPVIWGR